ncbi:hypothetical protein ACFQO7_31205 [Catellatospora aurea]|uniref:Uncharacterized protein n=1 Tax=Catellatospora aurea TaxID=1337874 RepID=A0ABW2H6H9_9ACTN
MLATMTMRRAQSENIAARSQQMALTLIPRRLDAFEVMWRELFAVQSGQLLTDERLDRLISASLWMPPHLRESLLQAVTAKDPPVEQFRSLREQLLEAAGTDEIDVAMKRLRERRGG